MARVVAANVVAASCLAVGAAVASRDTVFQRLASAVRQEPEPVRADFAALVLDEIIAAYEAELDRLSGPGQVSRREQVKQARWGRALVLFIDELYAARDELYAGATVDVVVQPPAPVQVLVGERSVPVSSPRLDHDDVLERLITSVFCETFPCGGEILEPLQRARAPAVGGWSFRDGYGSTFETPDGLGFMFSDVRARGLKEAACRRVHDDLLRLVQVLSVWHGTVDYDALRLRAAPRANVQQVVISHAGATVTLPLPALGRAPAVLEVARGWIRARVAGHPYRQLFPRAELMLSALLAER